MNLELLLKQARETNRERDRMDRALDGTCPADSDAAVLLLTAIEAIECGITSDSWAAVAEGLAMAHEVLARLAEAPDPMCPRGHRSWDEIQRAHDLVGQYCVETEDEDTYRYVSALCWILRHDHSTGFAEVLKRVENRLERLGIEVMRLPELQYPDQGKPKG